MNQTIDLGMESGAVNYEPYDLKGAIEALIFGAAKAGISYYEIHQTFGHENTEREIKECISALKNEYSGKKGVHLIEFTEENKVRYQFRTNHNYGEYISGALRAVKERHLSKSVLQTLSIIAYKQPVKRGDIESMRGGISCDYQIDVLAKAELIEIVDRTRSGAAMYATTSLFLKRFGLKSIEDLPDHESILSSIKTSEKYNMQSENPFEMRNVNADNINFDENINPFSNDEIAAALDAEEAEMKNEFGLDEMLEISSDN